jgi:hypothetical protein
MTDQREMELVSASLDGELNGDEQFELDSLLQSSGEARELKSELEQLDSILKNVPDVEPPASLHEQIMSRANPKPEESKPSGLDWLRDLVPGSGLRYVLATGAGAIMALIIVGGQPMEPGAIDYSDLVGTMSPDAGGADVLDSYSFTEEGFDNLIQLRLNGSVAFLDISTDTEKPLDISVDFGDAGQAVQVQALGQQRFTILLRRIDNAKNAGEAEITLEISSEGKLLDQGELKATW